MPTLTEERNVLISFLSRLAEVFSFINDPDPQRGGAEADKTQVQIYFWDRRQFEELAKAIGRHLNAIVVPPNDQFLRGLVWLFPPDQTLQDDEIIIANPVTFLKSVLQRDLRLPVPHCLTMFNVAEAYHDAQFAPQMPGSFYRDPFSDMIPRERVYEIWSGEPLIRVGNVQKTRSQCITDYSEVVEKQVLAIRNIVWKFRTDMTGRLRFTARPLDIGVPFNFNNMSEDGRLWYGWARLEEACDELELRRAWSAEPEELEASYDILRFSQLLTQTNNDLTFQVRPSSRDCKFRDGEDFLALQVETIPGFLDLRIRDIAPASISTQLPHQDRNCKMARIFQAKLIAYDRATQQAQVRLTDYRNMPALRQLLVSNNVVDLGTACSLISTSGPSLSDRIRKCLIAIGRPAIAVAAPATYQALGHPAGTNLPRNDALTPVARILWDAGALAVHPTNNAAQQIVNAIQLIAAANWPLNNSQRDAVTHCLSRRLSIVWGPPGTGKTTTAAALIAARVLIAQATGENLRILISGPTYTAWEKLFGDTLTLLEALHATNLNCFRVYSATHEVHAQLPTTTAITVTDVNAAAQDINFMALVQALQTQTGVVMVGSVAQQCYRIVDQSVGTALHPFFNFAVIDESSQLDIGKALFPLCLLTDDAGVVLFGDHLQMPPVVSTEPPRNAEWLVGSIQTYLIHRHACPIQPLLVNYRAADPFVAFGRRIGYPPNLTAHSPGLQLHRLDPAATQPANWNATTFWFPGLVQILEPQRNLVAITYSDGRAGQANDFEADMVCSIVQQLFLTFSQYLFEERDSNNTPIQRQHAPYAADSFWDKGVGIVTPHRAQRALVVRRLRQIFHNHPPEKIDAAVDTVERFQGGQRDTIIISFGVGDPDLIADEEGFLLQLERTNVAISRARAKCVLVISDDLAFHLPSDRETIQTSKAVKSYVSDCCRQTLAVPIPVANGGSRQILLRWH